MLREQNWRIQTFPNSIKLNVKYKCLKSRYSWPYFSTILFSPFCVFLFLKPERERGYMAIEDTHPHSFPARPLSFFPYCSNRSLIDKVIDPNSLLSTLQIWVQFNKLKFHIGCQQILLEFKSRHSICCFVDKSASSTYLKWNTTFHNGWMILKITKNGKIWIRFDKTNVGF